MSNVSKSNGRAVDAATSEALVDLLADDVVDRIDGVVVGFVAGVAETGLPEVDFSINPNATPVVAKSTIPVEVDMIGEEVALVFEQGDPCKPIILGRMWSPRQHSYVEAHADRKRVVVEAEKEIVLKCGDASLTLTRAGKIILRGKYVLSRSSGVNRIKGGSVQIN